MSRYQEDTACGWTGEPEIAAYIDPPDTAPQRTQAGVPEVTLRTGLQRLARLPSGLKRSHQADEIRER